MTNFDAFILLCGLAVLWLMRAAFVAYLEYRVSIHRINSDHTTAARYWELIHADLQKQKVFNEQLLTLLNPPNKNGP